MRIALVHDWLTGMRGGEKVLALLCGLMPNADLFTLIRVPGACAETIERMRIRTSWLDDLPGVRHYYRSLLPIMPLAAEQMDATAYDLVVSCSHCVAKGVLRSPAAAHVCYCLTPMRYVWGQDRAYSRRLALLRPAWPLVRRYLRAWDRRSAARVDRFLANSRNVAARIRRTYGRSAEVVHSPIDTEFFTPDARPREDFYLTVTALTPYKRLDQAVSAFGRLGRPLRIIGTGPEAARLRRGAPDNVTFLGWQPDHVVRDHYRRCRALVFPGEEDFGLVPLEAAACGAPVIAYAAGGALETVLDARGAGPAGPTGVLYAPQTAEALARAVERFEQSGRQFPPERLRRWAQRFSHRRFLDEFKQAVRPVLRHKGLDEPWSRPTTD